MSALDQRALDALIQMLGALLLSIAVTALLLGLIYALLTAIDKRWRQRRAGRSSSIDRYLVGRPDDDGAALYLLDKHGVRRIARVPLTNDRAASSHRLIAILGRCRQPASPAMPVTMDIRLPEDWREEGFSVPLGGGTRSRRGRRRHGWRGISPSGRRR